MTMTRNARPRDAVRAGAAAAARRWLLALLGLPGAAVLAAVPVQAQQVQAALMPDTATVGDVVRVVVQVTGLPAGARVELPDTLPDSPGMENAARLRLRQDSLDGAPRVTAVYSVTPWRPGATPLPELSGRVVEAGGATHPLTVALPTMAVRSVLPADTAGVRPRPPRDVLGPARLWWPPVLAAVLILGLLTAFALWWRRRRANAVAPPRQRAPREVALAALDRAYGLGLLESGDVKAFYSLVTEAVRGYLAALDGRWGVDLTTRELLARMGRPVWLPDVGELGELLEAADLVKFARRRPADGEAESEWSRARAWVVRSGPSAPASEQAA